MPPPFTQIKVRVQARDGKILGPAKTVKQPLLTVRNVLTGDVLLADEPMNNQSSGTVVPESQFSDAVSRNAIVVEPGVTTPTPGPYWLEVPQGEGELIVQLKLQEPSLLEFKATAFAPQAVYASATMWVLPGMQLLADPGLVLTVAGLYVTIDQAQVSNGAVTITATVAMMCGCPITQADNPPSGEEPYWPSTEYNVSAQLRGNGGLDVYAIEMALADTSTYTGSTSVPPGTYEVWVVAIQAEETNVGFARTTVTVG
jgi:hypothetical protein